MVGIGSVVSNVDKLVDPFKVGGSVKAGGIKFDKSAWFKQSPYTEEFIPIPFNDGPIVGASNANNTKFFRANISDPNYIKSLEFNQII